jgi:Tfp pilus assembly protein PilN
MIRINLLAADRPAAQKKSSTPGAAQAYILLGLGVGLAALLCGAGYWMKSNAIAKLDEDISAAQKRKAELQAIKAQVDALEAKRNTFQRKVKVIEQLKLDQASSVHMVDEISKALPDFVWLTNMDQTASNVKFSGQSNSMTSVADFMSALQRTGWFPSVDLIRTNDQASLINFELSAAFKNPEAAAAAAAAASKTSPAPAQPAQR